MVRVGKLSRQSISKAPHSATGADPRGSGSSDEKNTFAFRPSDSALSLAACIPVTVDACCCGYKRPRKPDIHDGLVSRGAAKQDELVDRAAAGDVLGSCKDIRLRRS
jgi:hypothetical protein